jgi:glycosyltransferase involved in cell wall biosynthesis
MFKISAVIITKNEEKNIVRCLSSLDWADEIVIYDSDSSDKTIPLCKQFNCRIHSSSIWEGFGITKQKAVDLTHNDWVFVIDADEEISPELKNCLLSFKNSLPAFDAYQIKRISYYGNKLVKFSGWQNDYTLRLFNKNFARFNTKKVHESVVVKGKTSQINQPILHFTYPEIKTHIQKMTAYSFIGAQQAFEKGKKSTILYAFLNAFFKFIKMYFLKLGFLDGKTGFILALNSSFGVWLKYIYLWELCKKK